MSVCESMHPTGQALTHALHFVHLAGSTIEGPSKPKTLFSPVNLSLKGTAADCTAVREAFPGNQTLS